MLDPSYIFCYGGDSYVVVNFYWLLRAYLSNTALTVDDPA